MDFFDIVECPVDLDTDRGAVRIHDGYAAGGAWFLMEFLDDGPLKGVKVWMTGGPSKVTYWPHESEDGLLFNRRPGSENEDLDEVAGGDYRPDLEGLDVKLV